MTLFYAPQQLSQFHPRKYFIYAQLAVPTWLQLHIILCERMNFQRACISPILSDIRELSAVFVKFSLVYTNRSCNQVAHVLAKQVSDDNWMSGCMGEWQSAPACIIHLLTKDCNPDAI